MKKILLTLSLILVSRVIIFAQGENPVPDAYYLFDGTEWSTTVTDNSGNGNNGFWYNIYIGPNPSDPYDEGYNSPVYNAGYHADSGKIGGAIYFNGYHFCCDEDASAAHDVILLAGNNIPAEEDIIDTNRTFQGRKTAVTVSFWFKSDRNYEDKTFRCWTDTCGIGMHEREVLVDGGTNRGGFTIENREGFYTVTITDSTKGTYEQIGWTIDSLEDPSTFIPPSRVWEHLAFTFDGSKKEIAFYHNGRLAQSVAGGTNPMSVPYEAIHGIEDGITEKNAFVIGAENGMSPLGGKASITSQWWNGFRACERTYETHGADTFRLRTGWPAGGYMDEFAWWKDKALTGEQIKGIYTYGISKWISGELTIDFTFKITDGTNPLQDATIYINDDTLYTDENGQAVITLDPGSFSYTVTMEGYKDTTSNVIIETTAQSVTVAMQSVTFVKRMENEIIKVFPNPAKDNFNVYAPDIIKEIELYNIMGSMVLSKRPNAENTVIEISSLPEGIYLMVIQTNRNTITKKVQIK